MLIIVTLLGSKTPKGYFYKKKKCNSIAVGLNLIFQFYFFFCKTGITLVAKLVFRSNDAQKKKTCIFYNVFILFLLPTSYHRYGPTSTVPLRSDSPTWSWRDGNYSTYSTGLDIDEIPVLLAMCP